MPEKYAGKRRAKRKRKSGGKIIALLCAAAVVLAALFTFINRQDPPVIQGVREQIEVYEDEDLQAALLEGVTAVGGEDRPDAVFPVSVTIYQESGQETQECPPGAYRLVYSCKDGSGQQAEPVESVLIVLAADTEGPVIEGARDLTVTAGETVSYRTGVTATDSVDGAVQLQVDAAQVNLTQPGEYPVIYRASDSRGNETAVTVTVTVTAADPEETGGEDAPSNVSVPADVTQEKLDELADRVLGQILTSDMTQRQKARAIYDYVYNQIKYVGTSDKSSWITGAYIGLTQGRGDCFNYYALSKELLTRAGISNIDVERVGGATDHYWQLVNVGDGWYHFDACPHPTGYPITSFLITEEEARAYTEQVSSVRTNYYVYDYDSCPVTVVGTPAEDAPAEQSQQPAQEAPAEQSRSETIPPAPDPGGAIPEEPED